MKEEALKLEDELPPVLWANPKTEIHGIVDVRAYPLEGFIPLCLKQDADDMIRRLVEELDCANDYIKQYQLEKQGEPVAWWNGKSKFCSPRDKSWDAKTGGILSFGCNIPLYTTPQTKPLSDEEITQCLNESMDIKGVWGQPMMEFNPVNFARAIEERHGIK